MRHYTSTIFRNHFDSWYRDSNLQTYVSWKTSLKCKIWEFEENSWISFVHGHPNLSLAQACLVTVSQHMFWSITDQYPDLACRLHVHIRLMGNFGLNEGIPWITNNDDALCFVCKRDTETLSHFLFDCPDFREHFNSLCSNLCLKVTASNPLDGGHIIGFLMNLDGHHKAMLLLGCLPTYIHTYILSYTGNLHKRADINRLYVPRKQGGRGLASVEDIYISRHYTGRTSQ